MPDPKDAVKASAISAGTSLIPIVAIGVIGYIGFKQLKDLDLGFSGVTGQAGSIIERITEGVGDTYRTYTENITTFVNDVKEIPEDIKEDFNTLNEGVYEKTGLFGTEAQKQETAEYNKALWFGYTPKTAPKIIDESSLPEIARIINIQKTGVDPTRINETQYFIDASHAIQAKINEQEAAKKSLSKTSNKSSGSNNTGKLAIITPVSAVAKETAPKQSWSTKTANTALAKKYGSEADTKKTTFTDPKTGKSYKLAM